MNGVERASFFYLHGCTHCSLSPQLKKYQEEFHLRPHKLEAHLLGFLFYYNSLCFFLCLSLPPSLSSLSLRILTSSGKEVEIPVSVEIKV